MMRCCVSVVCLLDVIVVLCVNKMYVHVVGDLFKLYVTVAN
jgi:hypothetical protein